MNRSTVASRSNLELIDENYRRWRNDPGSVDPSWQAFFEGFELASARSGPPAQDGEATACPSGQSDLNYARRQAGVTRMIETYREIGHFLADLDPLGLTPPLHSHELLDLAAFGLSDADLDTVFYTQFNDPPQATLRELIGILKETYCRTIGVEYMHIQDNRVRRWLQERMEPNRNRPRFDLRRKQRIVLKLHAAELFETFLHSRFTGQKRFSLEGGEMLIPLLDAVVERTGRYDVREIVMGMPHRGRLNVLVNIMHKPYGRIFGEFEGHMSPESVGGDGDVKYHLGFSTDYTTSEGHTVHLSLTPNPSHLEAVDPVVEGRVRAKQNRIGDTKSGDRDRKRCMPILIHGDAAFAGQGLVAETLNLSRLKGYRTGGTIHVIVNNQIGFTTVPTDGRSTRYCTDVAKMIGVPIFHVNGEDVEAVVHVAELALDFRQQFGQDVVIDMVCYRRHGHNEGDEPAFTQPVMYRVINEKKPIRTLYTERLIANGDMTKENAEIVAETFKEKLEAVYNEVHNHPENRPSGTPGFGGPWAGFSNQYDFTPVSTGASHDILLHIARATTTMPEGFNLNGKLERIFSGRVKLIESNGAVDWGFAETLCFGSLLMDGTPIRLSGQDSRRGTFSHRHSTLFDSQTGAEYVPLNHLSKNQGYFTAYDSLLSEAAVLGFDYGYSLDAPKKLVLWEAQFGDFANGAQAIIDQFIASAESKWGRGSGIVMLLPHGYEGQGPEHSSARLERFLQLCADENIQVVNATTPAQYFHVLRRQMKRNFRKPLIIMTPKSLLRHKEAVSPVEELITGRFFEVLDDPSSDCETATRVVLCSGKVYYDLVAKREALKAKRTAIVRLEQLYPWPLDMLKTVLGRYRAAQEWAWVQEESQNMGAWSFVAPRFKELLGTDIAYVGRDASASPATGSHKVHEREQNELVEAGLQGTLPHVVSATPHAGRPTAVALSGKE